MVMPPTSMITMKFSTSTPSCDARHTGSPHHGTRSPPAMRGTAPAHRSSQRKDIQGAMEMKQPGMDHASSINSIQEAGC